MKLFLAFISDLFHVLPSYSRPEWSDLRKVDPHKPTVVLVSGFGATQRALSVIRRRLLQEGYNVVILSMDWQTLSDGLRGLYHMADKLSLLILQLRKTKEMRHHKIILVAHSAGGLVARYYVQILGGFHYTDGLITLGTPHRGTWIAAFGFLTHLILKGRVLCQMLPISPFIKHLNRMPFPEKYRMVSIYSKHDYVCGPKSTCFEGDLAKRPEIETVEVSRLSHSAFLLSKKSFVVLSRLLHAETQVDEVKTA